MMVLVEDVDGGDAWCVFVSACVEARTGLCWKTKNSVAFVVKPIPLWLCQYPGSESSRTNSYTNTGDIMHLLSPPTVRRETVSTGGLGWAEGLLVVDFGWGPVEVSGCPSGCDVFCGDVRVGDSDLGGF